MENEELVTHRFPTGSIGLASPVEITAASQPRPEGEPHRSWWSAFKRWLAPPLDMEQIPAVCIAPGTCLRMSHIPDPIRWEFVLNAVEQVTFTQLTAEPYQYRDAIRFANGRQLLLQSLREGVRFEVVSLTANEPEPAVVETRRARALP